MSYFNRYGCDKNAFEEIINKGIESNKETMQFLKIQALEIYESARIRFEAEQSALVESERCKWGEYHESMWKAIEDVEKYLHNWFDPIVDQMCYQMWSGTREKFPQEIIGIFENSIGRVFDTISFQGLATQLIEEIFDEQEKKEITYATK